jgi:hypothetical protein
MDWTIFAVVSLVAFFILHYLLKIYLSFPFRLHHSIVGWLYVGLGVAVWNVATVAVGFFLVAHHFVTEGAFI